MNSIKREEYIKKELRKKCIDEETQNYVLKYVNMNQQLFGDILDIDSVADRIVKNLHHSISSYSLNSLKELIRAGGFWAPYLHRIEIHPVYKFISKISKKGKNNYDSMIMHELDHCATTTYLEITDLFEMSRQDLENAIQQAGLEEKFKKIEKRFKWPIPRVGVYNVFFESNDREKDIKQLNLKFLNEGITAYKQEMYNICMGIKEGSSYCVEKVVARFIGEIIGRNELIRMHFDNDYNAMGKAFKEKTGQDLNKFVRKLNRSSNIMGQMFGKIYARHFEKKLRKQIPTIWTTNGPSKKRKRFLASIGKRNQGKTKPAPYTRVPDDSEKSL